MGDRGHQFSNATTALRKLLFYVLLGSKRAISIAINYCVRATIAYHYTTIRVKDNATVFVTIVDAIVVKYSAVGCLELLGYNYIAAAVLLQARDAGVKIFKFGFYRFLDLSIGNFYLQIFDLMPISIQVTYQDTIVNRIFSTHTSHPSPSSSSDFTRCASSQARIRPAMLSGRTRGSSPS